MIFIGIDVAKSTHFASAVNSDGEVLVNPFKFTNDDSGFNLFYMVTILPLFSLEKALKLVVLIQFKQILYVLLTLEKLRMIRLILFS